MKQQKTLFAIALLASAVVNGTAQASLVARNGGMVYDDVNNITWAADANLFQTQAASNPNLVNEIIAANGGVIYDTANNFDNGTYSLSNADFNTGTGQMAWWGAMAWANNLTLGGYTDWTLPTTVPALTGYNQTGSQMGDLFYNQLGGVAGTLDTGTSITTTHNANYNLFSNVYSEQYWSSSEYAPHGCCAWNFSNRFGSQQQFPKNSQYYAWAVRSGDVAASSVPIPAAAWLFLSGVIGVLSFTRKKQNSQSIFN